MKLYITGMSLFVLAVFYLPLVLWVLKRIWNSPRWHGIKKAGMLMLATVLAYVIPLGDVTINSLAMEKVCPTAGLHIYKTVEVEGFVGSTALRDTPYRFNESPTLKVDGTYYWRRFEKQLDGSISVTDLEQPTAEYEVVDGDWRYDQEHSISIMRDLIRHRISGQILAENLTFKPLPGWVDSFLVYRWFGRGGREGCPTVPAGYFKQQVIIPKKPLAN